MLSGVPHGTVLGLPLFLIMISDIDKDVSASKLVSFADDTRLYSGVGDVADCDNLQLDLNAVYDWASPNNMFLTPKSLVIFVLAPMCLPISQFLYIDPVMNIVGPSTHVRDLGVSMSINCRFDFHISNLHKRCSNLACWILRTFTIRDPQVMPTLYKSLIMSRLEYASQLWSHYLLKLYSLQRRRERYGII